MLDKFLKTLDKSGNRKPITVVSGLPRSGTSLMMQILVAGGMTALTDHIRAADPDNPKGYYEFERVKNLREGDKSWLDEAENKVVKIIALLLKYLPDEYNYKIIFMHRNIPEILASQRKMLLNRGEDHNKVSDEEMSIIFQKHLEQVDTWMAEQDHVAKIDINYKELVMNPAPNISRINHFLGGFLDETKMNKVIDPTLYRQRQTKNKPQ